VGTAPGRGGAGGVGVAASPARSGRGTAGRADLNHRAPPPAREIQRAHALPGTGSVNVTLRPPFKSHRTGRGGPQGKRTSAVSLRPLRPKRLVLLRTVSCPIGPT